MRKGFKMTMFEQAYDYGRAYRNWVCYGWNRLLFERRSLGKVWSMVSEPGKGFMLISAFRHREPDGTVRKLEKNMALHRELGQIFKSSGLRGALTVSRRPRRV